MKSLYEGLLDDNLFGDIETSMVDSWLKANCKSKYKIMRLKNGSYKIWGQLVINGADSIPPLNISYLEGNLYIENSNIEGLDGMFTDMATVKGNIAITGCDKLSSLTGLPWSVDGEVSITNCKSLRSLEGVKCLAGDVSLMRCGKRFNKSTVSKAFPAAVGIYCSEEDVRPNIVEAFQDPVLIRMYDQMRNKHFKFELARMFGTNIRLDEVSPSMRETFKMPADKAKMLKAVNSIIVRGGVNGFIATEDFDGNFRYFFNTWGTRFNLYTDWDKKYGAGRYGMEYKVTEIRDYLKGDPDIRLVHVWKPTGIDTGQIQTDRRRAQVGVINNDKESLKKILHEQQDKYKAAVKQLKALRSSDQYKSKVDEVNRIMERFSKFMNKYIADPKWSAAVGYKADYIFDAIRKGYERGLTHQQYGVVYAFQVWSKAVVRTLTGDGVHTVINSKDLDEAINCADKRLSDVGL